jgi:hypothetical protein
LAREELDFIEGSTDQLARMLGFQNVSELDELTGNRLATLKILLSFYRRLRTLAEFQAEGKLNFPAE